MRVKEGMSRKSSPRVVAAKALLGLSALILISSMFFPWRHPTNHANKFATDYGFFLDCARAGAWEDGLRLIVEGLGCISPSILGFILLVGAVLPRGRINAGICSLLNFILLLMLTVIVWVLFTFYLGDEDPYTRLLLVLGGGGVLLTLLTLFELFHIKRSLLRTKGWGDSVHLLPLVLFFVAGTGLAFALSGSEVWHSEDYFMIAVGSALGLVALGLRNLGKAGTRRPASLEESP